MHLSNIYISRPIIQIYIIFNLFLVLLIFIGTSSSFNHHLYPFSVITSFFLLYNKSYSSIDTTKQSISEGGIGRHKNLLFRDQPIFMDSIEIKYEEEFVSGKGGLKLFTCRWLPAGDEPKALIFLLQGYAMDASISMKGTATRLARAGYGVYGIDYIGHGKSEGLHGYIPNFDDLVQDCADHFGTVCEREESKRKLRYMMGESMGGAVVLFLHRMMPGFWDGAVLVAPMCKLADEMKPNPVVVTVLRKLCHVIPTWKLVPSLDIIEAAVRDPAAKEAARSNPYWYTGRPRLKTAQELIKATIFLEQRLYEVSLPFLVVHGGDDQVTDPSISKLLYESASSTNKTFKLYPGMWHALTYGELPENIDLVFKDTIQWLDEKTSVNNSRLLENVMKLAEDKQ